MDNSSRLRDAVDKSIEQMKGSIEEEMRKHPFKTRPAAQKWIYLKSHGYVADHTYGGDEDGGMVFYNQERPHIWGFFSWWGEVVWTKET